jgi:hypothetical protein
MDTTADRIDLVPASRPAIRAGRRATVWTGRVLSGLAALFLSFDAVAKLLQLAPVMEGTVKLGYPPSCVLWLGGVLLTSVIAYLVPRTSVLGAVLLTGYLGGAIATHVRVSDPLLSHTLFPIYVAVFVWGGLYLRDARTRRLIGRPGEVSEGASAFVTTTR